MSPTFLSWKNHFINFFLLISKFLNRTSTEIPTVQSKPRHNIRLYSPPTKLILQNSTWRNRFCDLSSNFQLSLPGQMPWLNIDKWQRGQSPVAIICGVVAKYRQWMMIQPKDNFIFWSKPNFAKIRSYIDTYSRISISEHFCYMNISIIWTSWIFSDLVITRLFWLSHTECLHDLNVLFISPDVFRFGDTIVCIFTVQNWYRIYDT